MIGPIELALKVARTLDELGIPYVVGGSVASSALGEPRATMDIDIAVRMGPPDLPQLVAELTPDFYIPEESAAHAVASASSFNALHSGGLKVDLFVLGQGALDTWQMERRLRVDVGNGEYLWVTAPATMILRKLEWFRLGGEISDRQWRDVIGLIRIQHSSLELGDLRADAAILGLGDLLERALTETGVD